MKIVNKQGRQGDVLGERLNISADMIGTGTKIQVGELTFDLSDLEVLPKDEDGTTTIVKGEATHHHHLFPKDSNIETYFAGEEEGIKKYIVVVKEQTELQHFHVEKKELTGEHASNTYPPGVYAFNTQRQTNWENEIRAMLD